MIQQKVFVMVKNKLTNREASRHLIKIEGSNKISGPAIKI